MSESIFFSSLENLSESYFMTDEQVSPLSHHHSCFDSVRQSNNSPSNVSLSPPPSPVYGTSRWPRQPPSPVSVAPYYPPSSPTYTCSTPVPRSQCVAMDCEMVGVGPLKRSVLARVTIVNYDGELLFDTFVKVEEKVTDYRTYVSGVNPEDLKSDKALTFGECRRKVMLLLEGKVLVGHGLENDLRILNIGHPWHLTRDTSLYTTFMRVDEYGCFKPGSLRYLARRFLSKSIQESMHCSREDACAAMDLYKLVKAEWDYTISVAVSRTGAVKHTSCFCPPPSMPIHPSPSPVAKSSYTFSAIE